MNNWKIHFWWLVGFVVLLLVTVITFWLGGKGSEIASYIGFAGALVSIVLAVVAIIFAVIYNINSQQNIGEMRTLVTEVSRIIAEKANVLTDRAKSMELHLDKFLQVSEQEHMVAPLKDEKFQLSVSNHPPAFVLTLYSIIKAYDIKKAVFVPDIAKIFMGPKEWYNFYTYMMGVLQSFSSVWEPNQLVLIWDKETKYFRFEVKNLPMGIEKYIGDDIERRIKDSKYKEYIETTKERIDAYFAAA